MVKIQADEEGLNLLKESLTDVPVPVEKTATAKQEDWKKRALRRIAERRRVKGKLIIPTELGEHLELVVKWLLPPLIAVVVGTELEQSGHNMAGITWLLLVTVAVVGWWLYLKLLENSNQLNGVLWRGGLFTAGLFLGVVYGAS